MPSIRSLLLCAGAVSCLSGAAWADDAQPVLRSVVLSSAGLGEFTREVPAEAFTQGRADVRFPVLAKDINDTLKSLLVAGPGLSGVEMRLPSASVIEDVFAGLPFAPQDLGAVDALLARLPGASVRIDVDNGVDDSGAPVVYTVEGRVMGVAQDSGCAPETRCQSVVLVQRADGALERVAVWDGVRVTLLDEADRAKLARGLDALASGAASDGATIDLALEGDGTAPVLISTVLEAPMWKTSYRAAVRPDGSVALQAWATVENATQEDWVDVALSIVSGTPRTIAADLYARRYAQRERVDGGGMGKAASPLFAAPQEAILSRSADAEVFAMEMAPSAPPVADYGSMGGMDTGTVVSDQTSGARFDIPGVVSVRAGEVLSLPFLTGDLPARAVAYHAGANGGGADWSPMALALDVENDRPARLPEGVATIYADGTGFAGDTLFPAMEPGSHHVTPFLADSGARVRQTFTSSEVGLLVSVRQGMVRLESTLVRTTRYDVEAPAQKGIDVVIDHPAPAPGVSMAVEGAEPTGVVLGGARSVERLEAVLPADGAWSVEVVEREPSRSEWFVGDVDDTQLLAWSSQAVDDATRAWLERAVELRGVVFQAQSDVEQSDVERSTLVEDQSRLAGMLGSVNQGTEAHDRFLGQILVIEDRLADLDAGLEERRAALEAAQKAYDAHIAG
jgi:Domain of unknown function (DUF4139)